MYEMFINEIKTLINKAGTCKPPNV